MLNIVDESGYLFRGIFFLLFFSFSNSVAENARKAGRNVEGN
jgi:hypothetical protein